MLKIEFCLALVVRAQAQASASFPVPDVSVLLQEESKPNTVNSSQSPLLVFIIVTPVRQWEALRINYSTHRSTHITDREGLGRLKVSAHWCASCSNAGILLTSGAAAFVPRCRESNADRWPGFLWYSLRFWIQDVINPSRQKFNSQRNYLTSLRGSH